MSSDNLTLYLDPQTYSLPPNNTLYFVPLRRLIQNTGSIAIEKESISLTSFEDIENDQAYKKQSLFYDLIFIDNMYNTFEVD